MTEERRPSTVVIEDENSAALELNACFIGRSAGLEERRYILGRAAIEVGRTDRSDLTLDFAGVSRRHAMVFVSNDGVRVEDLQSTNGVRVNGVRVADAWLAHGDRVRVGTAEFDFVLLKHLKQEAADEIQAPVFIDPVTGMMNRRFLRTNMRRDFPRVLRAGRVVSIVRFDVVGFETLVMNHDEPAVHAVLRAVGRRAADVCRPQDLVTRVEEPSFLAVLFGVTRDEARVLALAIHAAVSTTDVVFDGEPIAVDVACGVTDSLELVAKLGRDVAFAMDPLKAFWLMIDEAAPTADAP